MQHHPSQLVHTRPSHLLKDNSVKIIPCSGYVWGQEPIQAIGLSGSVRVRDLLSAARKALPKGTRLDLSDHMLYGEMTLEREPHTLVIVTKRHVVHLFGFVGTSRNGIEWKAYARRNEITEEMCSGVLTPQDFLVQVCGSQVTNYGVLAAAAPIPLRRAPAPYQSIWSALLARLRLKKAPHSLVAA